MHSMSANTCKILYHILNSEIKNQSHTNLPHNRQMNKNCTENNPLIRRKNYTTQEIAV